MPERTPPRRPTYAHAYCPRPECGRLVVLQAHDLTMGDDAIVYAHHHLPVPASERRTRDIRTMPWCEGSGALVVKPLGAKPRGGE